MSLKISTVLKYFTLLSLIFACCGTDTPSDIDATINETGINNVEGTKTNDGLQGDYFRGAELCTLAKKMAMNANKDIGDVFLILKKDNMLFDTKWKYEHKEAVIKIIAGAVKKAKDASDI